MAFSSLAKILTNFTGTPHILANLAGLLKQMRAKLPVFELPLIPEPNQFLPCFCMIRIYLLKVNKSDSVNLT